MKRGLILFLALIFLPPAILSAQSPQIFLGGVYNGDQKVSGIRFGSALPITPHFYGLAYGQAALSGGAAATDIAYMRKWSEWPGLGLVPLLSKLPISLGVLLGPEFDVSAVGDNAAVSTYLNAAVGGLANYEIGKMYGAWLAAKKTILFDPNAAFPAGWTFGGGLYLRL